MATDTPENETAQGDSARCASSTGTNSSSTGPAHVGAVFVDDAQNIVADALADELADLLVGPVLDSHVSRAFRFTGEGYVEAAPANDADRRVLNGGATR